MGASRIAFERTHNRAQEAIKAFRESYERESAAEILAILRRLELDWPTTGESMLKLAEYISDCLVVEPRKFASQPGVRVPVLYKALEEGLIRYDEMRGQADDLRLLAFLKSSVSMAARLLTGVGLADGARHWHAGAGMALEEWLATASRAVTIREQSLATTQRVETAIKRHIVTDVDRYAIPGWANG